MTYIVYNAPLPPTHLHGRGCCRELLADLKLLVRPPPLQQILCFADQAGAVDGVGGHGDERAQQRGAQGVLRVRRVRG